MVKSSSEEKIRALRIKALIKREGIKQKDLADDLQIEPQNLSRCLCSGNVSEKMCRKIIEAYPAYRLPWLLGYDDFMTWYEWADHVQDAKDHAADAMWCIIERSLNKEGKSLRFVHHSGQHVDSSERLRADCHYSIVDRKGKELKRLTALEMVQFEQKIQEYCDFLTSRYL